MDTLDVGYLEESLFTGSDGRSDESIDEGLCCLWDLCRFTTINELRSIRPQP
jgi:hypothetical protein